jgi:hypothetical protein
MMGGIQDSCQVGVIPPGMTPGAPPGLILTRGVEQIMMTQIR